jgi:hypothetical protein
MPSTFQAAVVTAVALLPGALYLWALERQVGRYGIGLSDRVLRFVGGSAVFLSVFAGPLYVLYGRFGASLASGEAVPAWFAVLPLLFVGIPLAAGTLQGLGLRRGWTLARLLTGPNFAPRAWDYVFWNNQDGWIRCRLKSGTWLGGAFADAEGKHSYAAGYPEPQDLFLVRSVHMNPDTGAFELDSLGRPRLGEGGILVRWEEVEYLEFIDA